MKKFISFILAMIMIFTSFIVTPIISSAAERVSFDDWRSVNFNSTVTDYLNTSYYWGEGYTDPAKGFTFTATTSGKVTIKLKNYIPGNVECRIMPLREGKNIGTIYSSFKYSSILGYIDNETVTLDLMKGKYAMLLTGSENEKVSFSLSFLETKESFPESIDTYKSTVYANDYNIISVDEVYYGQFSQLTTYGSSVDIDYYTISLNKGKLWFDYNSTDCGANITLYNSKSEHLSLIYDEKHDISYYNIPSTGTYYIQLKGSTIFDNSGYSIPPYGAYSFKFTQTNPYPTIQNVTLNKTSFVYNGKKQQPTVKVVDSNGNKVDSEYYTVKYSGGNSKSIGYYYVTIEFKGKYKAESYTINGEKWADSYLAEYTIKPKSTKVSKLSNKKNKLTVKWKKQTSVSGYQIQYSTDKNFKKNKKTITVKSKETTSKTITKLKKKKTYYVRVRTYKSLGKKDAKIYSSWSSAEKIKM